MKIYHKVVGHGPDLVLMPGWAFHSEIWSSLLKYLENQFTVHLFDLPGFGRMHDFEMPDNLEQCIDVIYPELPKTAHYIAWSLGGLFTLALATQFPLRVQSIITIGSSPCFLQQNEWNGVTEDYFNRFYQAVEQNSSRALQQFILFSLAERSQQKKYFSILQEMLGEPNHQALLIGLKILKQVDLREDCKKIRCPYKSIVGNIDPLTAGNSQYPAQELQNAGHFPMLTHTAELYSLIQGFYAK